MVKFFVPATNDLEEAERVFEATRKFNNAPVQERKIASISWRHNNMDMKCYVGGHLPEHFGTGTDLVCVILDAGTLYMICTRERGVVRGEPVYAGKEQSTNVSYFEDQ
jgi:hypothetical protein